jgi:hypothetical protein
MVKRARDGEEWRIGDGKGGRGLEREVRGRGGLALEAR